MSTSGIPRTHAPTCVPGAHIFYLSSCTNVELILHLQDQRSPRKGCGLAHGSHRGPAQEQPIIGPLLSPGLSIPPTRLLLVLLQHDRALPPPQLPPAPAASAKDARRLPQPGVVHEPSQPPSPWRRRRPFLLDVDDRLSALDHALVRGCQGGRGRGRDGGDPDAGVSFPRELLHHGLDPWESQVPQEAGLRV